uniref:Uncharacterized protein n=1 Tax=uncultured prokaryote TaxID=198431 RepID=A0A0H5Q1Z3_9ZZZZ|nr:hypothetical protein [uncultured prokaryote]
MHSTLSYHPVVPGSDQHLSLVARAIAPDPHRRACAVIAAAGGMLRTKQETPRTVIPEASVPIINPGERTSDGCFTECA